MHKISRIDAMKMSRDLDVDLDTMLAISARVRREGIRGATMRFPAHRAAIIRRAEIFRDRPQEAHEQCGKVLFANNGINWVVCAPVTIDKFSAIIHDRDVHRSHVRIALVVADIAVGEGVGAHLNGHAASQQAVRDPALKVNVCREMGPIIAARISLYIQDQKAISPHVKKFAKAIGAALTHIDRILPHTVLKVRRLPSLGTMGTHRLSVDMEFTVTFELGMDTNGGVIPAVDIVTDGAMFEIAAGVDAVGEAHACTDLKAEAALKQLGATIEAISPQNRRRRIHELVEKGPEPATHSETLTEEGGEQATMEIVEPEGTETAIEASLREDAEAAVGWWREHRGLIQPTLGEISSSAISAYGSGASRETITTLIDLSLPTLYNVARKRETQLETGLDAAVIGLARLLRNEFIARLR